MNHAPLKCCINCQMGCQRAVSSPGARVNAATATVCQDFRSSIAVLYCSCCVPRTSISKLISEECESFSGVLIYPDGGRYTAEWEEGLAVKGNYSFKDGLAYQLENWSYLAPNDRRFVEEYQHGFDPQRAVQRRGPRLPQGTYDTGITSREIAA